MPYPTEPPPTIVPAGMPFRMAPPIMPPIVPAGIPPMLSQPPPSAGRRGDFRTGSTIGSRPQMYNNNHLQDERRKERERGGGVQVPNAAPTMDGPVITVFIGNISDKAPDPMIKKILASCGTVINWKRVSTFGFCEYDGAVAGARAVRLLHDLQIDGKKLVAKVDAKNKALLDNHKEEEKPRNEQSEQFGDDDALDLISRILDEFRDDFGPIMEQPEGDVGVGGGGLTGKQKKQLQTADMEEGKRELISKEIGKFRKYTEEEELKKEKEKERRKAREEKKSDGGDKRRSPSPSSRKDRDKDKDKEKEKKSSSSSSRRRSRSRSRDRDRQREPASRSSRDLQKEKEMEEEARERRKAAEKKAIEKEAAYQERLRNWENTASMRRRSRSRSREREREREREVVVRNPRDIQKEKEMEEEARDRRKTEKKAMEKEAAYQERLRNWEARERRKAKDYEKDREKERCKEEEREKEAKRLKEFLEDYDDERDDPKYYKGRELQRRLAERVREADLDSKDRNREQEELDELKNKIFSGEYDNPTLEFEKEKKKREEMYRPKILIDVNLEQSQQRERELERERLRELERQRDKERVRANKERYVIAQASRELAAIDAEPIESDSSGHDDNNFDSPLPGISSGGGNSRSEVGLNSNNNSNTNNNSNSNNHHGQHHHHHPQHAGSETRDSFGFGSGGPPGVGGMAEDDNSRHSMRSNSMQMNSPGGNSNSEMNSVSEKHQPIAPTISLSLNAAAKKKKLEMKDVFNSLDEDGEESNGPKKRKLVLLDDENRSAKTAPPDGQSAQPHSGKNSKSGKSSGEDASGSGGKSSRDAIKSQEEKRRHIKSIIDKIPTEKADLFNYPLDWNEIDATIEKKIRPWINKKIIEYIGEPEPTLVDFICSKVLAGSTPQGILDDVQMVLDEEAEVFVVKMWRLLIYEVEAKKVGLTK